MDTFYLVASMVFGVICVIRGVLIWVRRKAVVGILRGLHEEEIHGTGARLLGAANAIGGVTLFLIGGFSISRMDAGRSLFPILLVTTLSLVALDVIAVIGGLISYGLKALRKL